MRLAAASTGSRISYNKLSKTLGLSLDTVKDYISYLEGAFLLKSIEKWSTSHSERIYAQKKVYLWDNGIRTLLTGPGDEGSKAENAVFMEISVTAFHAAIMLKAKGRWILSSVHINHLCR